jgi:hypothetical protein
VGAVNPVPRPRIDIELAVNHDVVAGVGRHGRRKSGVVIDLQHLAGRCLDLESFVPSRFHWFVQQNGVESHLGAIGGVDDVLVERLVVRRIASGAGDSDQRCQEHDSEPLHVASACSRVMRPS